MASGNVKPTHLTTDSPGASELFLCDGFAMFPWLGAIRAGVDLHNATGTWFDKTFNFELFVVSMAATHSAFIGVCGPAYATEIDTDARTSYEIPDPGQPSSGTLVVGDHALRGGFQAGIDFQVAFGIDVTLNLILKRKRLIDFDVDLDIDVIELIYNLLIKLLAGGGGGQAEGNPNEFELATFSQSGGEPEEFEVEEGHPSGQSPGRQNPHGVKPEFTGSGMVDFIDRPWLAPPNKTEPGTPSATLEPSIGYGFSIVPLFAEIPVLDLLYGLDEALEAIGGGFELGPGVNIGFPTTVTLKGATVSNHPFDVASSSGSDDTASFDIQERTPVSPQLQPLTDTADEIGVLLEHEVGFQLGLYFYVELTFFKVLHVGAQTGTIPLIGTDKLPDGAGGPFENHLSFIPGGGVVPFDAPTTAPTVGPYTANQPQGSWKDGVIARYGVSFFSASYESEIGPFSDFEPERRFFAFPELSDIPVGPLVADGDQIAGRRIYRQFNDGSEPIPVGTINDNETTTFTDTHP